MSTQFLALSVKDRKLAFDDAALSLQLNAVILEKDFWVAMYPFAHQINIYIALCINKQYFTHT